MLSSFFVANYMIVSITLSKITAIGRKYELTEIERNARLGATDVKRIATLHFVRFHALNPLHHRRPTMDSSLHTNNCLVGDLRSNLLAREEVTRLCSWRVLANAAPIAWTQIFPGSKRRKNSLGFTVEH